MMLANVLLVSTGTALATGLGALPLAVFRRMSPSWVTISNALAAGFMIGAGLGLFYEGATIDGARMVAGAVLGGLFVGITHGALGQRKDLHAGALRGANARKALLIIGVMTLHSFTEGVGVGVSFADGESFGLFVALAIAIHNIPEGLAISLALVPSGTSVRSAAGWSIFSSLPQPVMAVPAFLGVRIFEPLLAGGLGFAGGAMIWLVSAFMLPEALREAPLVRVASVTTGGAIVMIAIGSALAL